MTTAEREPHRKNPSALADLIARLRFYADGGSGTINEDCATAADLLAALCPHKMEDDCGQIAADAASPASGVTEEAEAQAIAWNAFNQSYADYGTRKRACEAAVRAVLALIRGERRG